VQGSVRDAGQTFRITHSADGFAWYVADPYMAKPTDVRAADRPHRDNAIEMNHRELTPAKSRSAAMSDVADEAVNYPQYGKGLATIDVLFYHEEGMEDAASVADFVIEIANQAFTDSGIDIIVNIVDVKPLAIDADTTQSDVLSAMYEAEAPFEDIESDRAFYAADIVVALRENIPEDDDSCGVAYIGVTDGSPWRRLYMSSVQWRPVDKAVDDAFDEAVLDAMDALL